MFSSSLFTFRFNAHCHCVDAWISAGKSNGFDAMENKKKKKKMQEERVQRERREKQNPKNNIRIVKKGK